jgi:hypothetical protein
VGLCRSVWVCVGLCRSVWVCVGLCGSVWVCVGLCGSVWVCVTPQNASFAFVCAHCKDVTFLAIFKYLKIPKETGRFTSNIKRNVKCMQSLVGKLARRRWFGTRRRGREDNIKMDIKGTV